MLVIWGRSPGERMNNPSYWGSRALRVSFLVKDMVAPIVGPLRDTFRLRPAVWPGTLQANSTYDSFERLRDRYRQKRPYNRPLPFWYRESKVTRFSTLPHYDATNSTGDTTAKTRPFGINDSAVLNTLLQARQDAVKRFNGELKEAASWMVSLAERRQAIAMMESRLTQMLRFTRNLRRGRFGDAARDLISKHDRAGWETYRRKQREGRFRKGSKFFADNYLEFHFGWSPAVSDIYATIDILQRGVPAEYCKGSGSATSRQTFVNGSTRSWHDLVVRYKVGASISVTNPNLWLANQLGLVNPALLIFETIPFSFVLDWFVNVSEFLGQFTEYWGLNVVDPWTQAVSEDKVLWTWRDQYINTTGGGYVLEMVRDVGALPTVDLRIRKPWQLSVRRGAAAASLLVQLLK